MGGYPETIYADGEAAWSGHIMRAWFEERKIKLILTRAHASVAERHIRTIRGMIDKRLEHLQKPVNDWQDVLPEVLKQYNNKMVHSAHDMTPAEASRATNESVIKGRLEVNRIKTRRYPPVEVGDKVKVYQRKDKLDKERVSTWQNKTYTVESISEARGQKFYTVTPKIEQWEIRGRRRPLVRSEILLIP